MRTVFLSGIFVSLGMFLGRLSGFVRETFIASQFGATEQTDLIIVFLSAPDVLVNLLVGGALGMALIPEFKRLSRLEAIKLYQQIFVALIGMFSLVGVGLGLWPEIVLKLFAPGLSDDIFEKHGMAFSISFIAIPLTVAAGVTTAFLHYENKFIVASLGTLIFNIVLITGLYLSSQFRTEEMLYVIAVAVCIASLVRWGTQVHDSKMVPFDFSGPVLINKSLIKRYCYCVLTGGVIFIIPVVARALASQSGVGELSLVNFAIKLVEFPLGVILTVFSVVFFPRFSQLFAERNETEFLEVFKTVILIVVIVSIATFVPLNIYSSTTVNLIYDWGQLSDDQLSRISSYFHQVSFTLPFQGINALLVAVIVSRRDALSPLLCSSILTILFVTLGYTVVTEIVDVFNLMVLVYALLSVSLLSVLGIKHSLGFMCFCSFVPDVTKVILLAVGYYYFMLSIQDEGQSLWYVALISVVSSLVFLTLCALVCQRVRMVFKVKKDSKCLN